VVKSHCKEGENCVRRADHLVRLSRRVVRGLGLVGMGWVELGWVGLGWIRSRFLILGVSLGLVKNDYVDMEYRLS